MSGAAMPKNQGILKGKLRSPESEALRFPPLWRWVTAVRTQSTMRVKMRSARILQPTNGRTHRTEINWSQRVGITVGPDFLAVVAFCLIGLLLSLNFMLRFPEFGAIIQQYNQF